MRRYWLEPESFLSNSEVQISGEALHHIFSVCRQEVGSRFEVLGQGTKAHLIEIVQLGKKSATGKILETRDVAALPKPHLVLALSVSRFPVMDAIIEKAVEMGVHRIQPFYSDFSFIRKTDGISDNKLERWKKIIVSATQQCGRGELMVLSSPIAFHDLPKSFNQKQSARGLFAYEGHATLGIKSYLKSQNLQAVEEFWLFIGSEGGFSPTEVQEFQKWGLQPVSLGEQILRVETACITTLAILKYELGQMGESRDGKIQ